MGIQADLFKDAIDLIKKHKIEKLTDVRKKISSDNAYDFIEKLLWNFGDSIERDRKEDREDEDG